MKASASVSGDTKSALDKIHADSCDVQKLALDTFGKMVKAYKNGGTHSEADWKSKLGSELDTVGNTASDRINTGAKDEAVNIIDKLDNDDQKNTAAAYNCTI